MQMQMCRVVVAIAFLAATAARAEQIVGSYACNEGSGLTIFDSSPIANHGTISSDAMWSAPGYDGTGCCLHYAGTNSQDEATVPHHSLLNFDGYISLSAWVNPSPSTWGIYPIIHKGQSQTAYTLQLNNYGGGHELEFMVNYNTGGVPFTVRSDHVIPYGEWTHVAATYDMEHVRLYVGGTLVKEEAVTIPIVNNSQPLYFGVDLPGFPERFDGYIDQPVITVPEPAVLSLLTLAIVLLGRQRAVSVRI